MCSFIITKSLKSVAIRSFCLFDNIFFRLLKYLLATIYNFTLVDRKNRELEREDTTGNYWLNQKKYRHFWYSFCFMRH